MLPVVASTNTFSFQTPLVNTTIPGTNVARVPYDNVAPSVSNAQIENNTQANTTIVSQQQQSPADVATDTSLTESGSSAFLAQQQRSVSASLSSGVQSTFVAQLAAQDGSPETQGILVQYEKLVANGNVKYKPSNAQKPDDGPSSIFGQILQSEKSAPQVAQTPQPPVEVVKPETSAQVAVQAVEAAPVEEPRPTTKKSSSDTASAEPAPTSAESSARPDNAQRAFINAYTATAARVGSFNSSHVPSPDIAVGGLA